MSGKKWHTCRLSNQECLIASRDEISIEAELFERDDRVERLGNNNQLTEDLRAALKAVNRLKISGQYCEERARLAVILKEDDAVMSEEFWARNPNSTHLRDAKPNPELVHLLGNLMDGLKSPNKAQQERFRAFYEAAGLADMTPRDSLALIGALEPAQKQKGRPSVSPPWRNIVSALDAMRLLVANGKTVANAARVVAAEEGRAGQDGRASYFAKNYIRREELRE